MTDYRIRPDGLVEKQHFDDELGNVWLQFWPNDDSNPESVKYDAWKAKGNTPESTSLPAEEVKRVKQRELAKKYSIEDRIEAIMEHVDGKPARLNAIRIEMAKIDTKLGG